MEKYNVIKASQAQKKYQKKTGSPKFAPLDGTCWSCKRNIYEPHYWKTGELTKTTAVFWESYSYEKEETSNEDYDTVTGVTVKEAGDRLITGCPHCNRSYCD